MIENVLPELLQSAALATRVRFQITDYFAEVVFFQVVLVLTVWLYDSVLA